MNRAEYDDRTWAELDLDELIAEASELAVRYEDEELARKVAELRSERSHIAAELVIHTIERDYADPSA